MLSSFFAVSFATAGDLSAPEYFKADTRCNTGNGPMLFGVLTNDAGSLSFRAVVDDADGSNDQTKWITEDFEFPSPDAPCKVDEDGKIFARTVMEGKTMVVSLYLSCSNKDKYVEQRRLTRTDDNTLSIDFYSAYDNGHSAYGPCLMHKIQK